MYDAPTNKAEHTHTDKKVSVLEMSKLSNLVRKIKGSDGTKLN